MADMVLVIRTGVATAAANEASSELLQTFKSAEHLGGNSGGKSLSFRLFFTLKFDFRRLHQNAQTSHQ
jgi:hypothetical protein